VEGEIMELERIFFSNWDEIKKILYRHIPWKTEGNVQKIPINDYRKRKNKMLKMVELDITHVKMKRC
jgi:hypothetical protein